MSISFILAGRDVTAGSGYRVEQPSVRIQEDTINDQWELDFDLTITNGVITPPDSNQEIIVQDGSTKEYAGTVATVKEKQIDPTTFRYSLVCNNYQQQFDRHLVAETYPQQNADVTVKAIVNAYCPGFTTNHVQSAPTIPTQRIDYKAPSKQIKNFANLLAWSTYIDYDKDVHFYLSESIPSPFPNNTLNADTDLTNYGDLELEKVGSQVKNRIFCLGFKIMSATAVPIYFVGDGQTTTFTLPQEPAGTTSKYMSLTVAGTTYNIVPDIAQGMPGQPGPFGNVNAYVSIPNMTVRFDTPPARGAVVSGNMHYKYQPVYVQDDPALIQQQAALEGGTDGIYEYAVNDPRMSGDDTSLAQARAGYLLAKYGTPNLQGTLVSYTPGLRAGQFFYLNSARRFGGISQQKMYICKREADIVQSLGGQTTLLRHKLTISDRPFLFS